MTIEAQQSLILAHYRAKLEPLGVKWGGFFTDKAQSGKVRLCNRPEGAKLVAIVRPTDHVIFAKLDRGFRKCSDFCIQMEEWTAGEIKVAILDLGIDTTTPIGCFTVQVLAAFAEMERKLIAERTRIVAQERKKRGLPHGGQAPYGWKFSGPRGKRIFIRDAYTRSIGAKIVKWRDEGKHSFSRIYWHLAHHHVRTRKNKEWSLTAIWKAYHAEKRLQAEEAANAD